jgi:TolB-like protein/DNA-binding winged helix-turn-helix (wHTH) protein
VAGEPDNHPMAERYLIAGPYRLDTRNERLSVDGTPVRLGGKALHLLKVFMEHPQMLMTKSDLFDFVWPGVAVSESVLTTTIKELRQALGDDARQPGVIETVHRRGYRFMLPVEEKSDEDLETAAALVSPIPPAMLPVRPDAVQRHSFLMVIGLAVAGLFLLAFAASGRIASLQPGGMSPYPKSVAVLPFENLSSEPDVDWFAEGLTEEVLDRLTRVPDLHVASRLSSLDLLQSGRSLPEAAHAVGVANVLEGTVRRANGRVRVTVQLIRAKDGFQIWSQNYDRPADDIISIQEDIAFEIASALQTVMDPEKLDAMVKVGTRSVEAYEAYLRGVSFDRRQLDDGGIDNMNAAADSYERARALDPHFAAAHWKSALTWFGNTTRINASLRKDEETEAERRRQFLVRVDAAIAASQDETETLRYLAARAGAELKLSDAHAYMKSYLEQRPRDIDAWDQYGDLSAYVGQRSELPVAAERIDTLSTESGDPQSRAITLYVQANLPGEAVATARRQLALRPEAATTLYQAHRAFIWAGEIAEARALLPRLRETNLQEANLLLAELRQACAEQKFDEARAVRQRIDEVGYLTARWTAAQTIGDTASAKTLLGPLDTPESLPRLIQFMIYPTFDAAQYPVLRATLKQAGIDPHPVIPVPQACAGAVNGTGIDAKRQGQ